MLPQARDRVAERPRRRFLRGTIGARVVRGAVTLGAIGEMLDQGRAVVGPRPVGRPLRRGIDRQRIIAIDAQRSEEHTSELQSLMRISYAVFCLKKKNTIIYK